MAKTSSLQALVNSLSKGEKRYFKLFTSLQQGGKDYLYLFDLLEKGVELKQLKKVFIKMKPGSSFETAAKYLFKVIYMGCGKIAKAHYYLNKILLESKLYYALPVYRTFRLLHLLVHDELGNHDYIASETRSIKRALSASRSKAYLLEKIIFKFVRQSSVATSVRNKEMQLKKIKKTFEEIRSDKYEIQLLKIFDFESWITARLSGRSFTKVIQEKYESGAL